MHDRHCSDGLLVAHLDGELSHRAERVVREHLSACWRCRARAAELEPLMHSLSRIMEEETYPGPDWINESKQRFREWRRVYDQSLGPTPQPSFSERIRIRLPLVAALTAAAVLVVIGLWFSLHTSLPQAAQVAARAERQEVDAYQKPVHLSYRVEIAQLRPIQQVESGRLEVWSDASSQRFTSKWRGDDGVLKFAVWRPSSGKQFVFDPDVSAGAVEERSPGSSSTITEIAANGLDSGKIGRGFLRWLQTRHWKPVSFAADLPSFVSEEGVLLQARRSRATDGASIIRLTARRTAGAGPTAITTEIVIDLDAVTLRPKWQRIRFETAERTMELRLTVERTDFVKKAELLPAVFEPDVPLAAPTLSSGTTFPSTRAVPGAMPTPDPVMRAAREIDVLYTLHRMSACLGESVEVLEDQGGQTVIRGMVATSARKQQYLAAFSKSGGGVKLEIQTVDEAVAKNGKAVSPPANSRPIPHGTLSPQPLPIEDELRQYFRAQRPGGDSSQKPDVLIAQLASQAVSESDVLLLNSWALRRLAERYGHDRIASLPPRAKWQLETMLHDHLAAVRQHSATLRTLTEPALSTLVGPLIVPAAPSEPAPTASLSAVIESEFRAAERIHAGVHFLFAGAEQNSGHSESPATTAALVLNQLRNFDAGIDSAYAMATSELSPARQATGTQPDRP
jgi:hypothetical protein